MEKPKIFISYSHKDTEWKDRLATYLGALQKQDLLNFWTDNDIGFGEEWFKEIEEAINTANAAILLVSVDFLNSPFILREEIGRLLKLRKENGFPIYPILIRQCPWKRVPWLAQLQMRPRNGKPLAAGPTEHDIDEHLTAIVEEIDGILGRLTKTAESPSQGKEKPESRRGSTAIPEIKGKETTQPDLHVSQMSKEEPPRIEVVSSPVPPLAPASVAPFTEITNSIGMKLILIPAGEFLMGSENSHYNEKPVRRVQIRKPFYLGKYPVTQAQWETVMGHNPSHFKGESNRPVETVSWYEAQEFLRKLSTPEGGKPYRLPTEAEWEYACRAGSTGAYYFGDNEAMLREYAWYDNMSFVDHLKIFPEMGSSHTVGQLKPNEWGLYDMLGNVAEWVQDWYAADYYKQRPNPDCDPQGPDKGKYYVRRGGAFIDIARYVCCAVRRGLKPGHRGFSVGFRCARSLVEGSGF